MSIITLEYVPRGWLWVALMEPTISYTLLRELACLISVLSSRVDEMMYCLACIDETTTGPVSLPRRY